MSSESSHSATNDYTLLSMPAAHSDAALPYYVGTKIFVAICEFSQGSFPKVIYRHGGLQLDNEESFLMYVVGTPVNYCSSDFDAEPSVIFSTFEGIEYLAVYVQIFDVDARGFTRPIVFVIAHNLSKRNLITKIHALYLPEIIAWVKRIQKPTVDHFHEGLYNFACSLFKIHKKLEYKNEPINSKVEQLKSILQQFNIKDLDIDNAVDRSLDYFVVINNNLVDIRELVQFDSFESDLDKFVDSLPSTNFQMGIISELNYYESTLSIDFGGSSILHGLGGFPAFAISTLKLDDSFSFQLKDLIDNDVFLHIVFTLLAGQTLIIKTNDLVGGNCLAQKLIVLCPFFRKSFLHIADSVVSTDCLKYSLVVTKIIDGETNNILNVLDFTSNFYKGDGCPPSTIVRKILDHPYPFNDTTLIFRLLSKLKTASSNFIIKLSEFASSSTGTIDSLISSLKQNDFGKNDAPILNYWIHSYFNKDKLKPILFNNHSKAGFTLVSIN